MKNLFFVTVLLFASGLLFSANSQTADDIINKHIEAIGGIDSLKAINTLTMNGKFNAGGMNAPVTMIFKRPDMVKMVIEFQGNSLIQCYDGTTAWTANPFSGKPDPEKMPAERTKGMKQMADFEGLLVNYAQKGFTAELMGKEDMEGTEVYKIRLTDKDNDITYFFLDTQTYLLLKETTKRKIKEKEIESETYYGNYQKFGGVMIALSVEFRQKGDTQGQTGTIETVELNTDVDDSIFKMPEENK